MSELHVTRDRAKERGCGVHMHIAQGARERLQITGRFGKEETTVKVMDRCGLLGPHLLAGTSQARCCDNNSAYT